MVKTHTQTHNLYKYNNKLRVGQNTLFNTQFSLSVGVCVDNDTANRWTDIFSNTAKLFIDPGVDYAHFQEQNVIHYFFLKLK